MLLPPCCKRVQYDMKFVCWHMGFLHVDTKVNFGHIWSEDVYFYIYHVLKMTFCKPHMGFLMPVTCQLNLSILSTAKNLTDSLFWAVNLLQSYNASLINALLAQPASLSGQPSLSKFAVVLYSLFIWYFLVFIMLSCPKQTCEDSPIILS